MLLVRQNLEVSILTIQTSEVKESSASHKRTKASHLYLSLCIISLLSIEALTPPGFMPGSILHGQLIKPCPNSFPIYDLDISKSSHHHHNERPKIEQSCAFVSQLSNPTFVTQNFQGNPSRAHSTATSKKLVYLKSSRTFVNPRAPPYLRDC